MAKRKDEAHNRNILILTLENVPTEEIKDAIQAKGLSERTTFVQDILPNTPAHLAILNTHGLIEDGTHYSSNERNLTSELLSDIQQETGATNLALISCYGGGVLPDIKDQLDAFQDGTGFLIFSGTKNSSSTTNTVEDIAEISALQAQGASLAQAFAARIPATAETLIYAEKIGEELYEVKFSSPKEAREGKRPDEIASLRDVESWKGFMRDNLKIRINGQWEALNWPNIPAAFRARAVEIKAALEQVIAPLGEPHLHAYRQHALTVANERGNLGRIKALIGAGADSNEPDKYGDTLIHYAASHDNANTAAFLLAHDAIAAKRPSIVEAVNSKGETPLHRAGTKTTKLLLKRTIPDPRVARGVARGVGVTKLLLKRKANVHARNNEGNTPLHNAVANGRTKVAELLLGAGAEVDVAGAENRPALHNAALNGKLKSTKLLLNYGAEIDAVDGIGATALYYSVLSKKPKVTELLLQRGANVHSPDSNLDTPLHNACQEGNYKMARILLQYGANIYAENQKGQTPWDIARENEDTKILTLFVENARRRNTPPQVPIAALLQSEQPLDGNIPERLPPLLQKLEARARDTATWAARIEAGSKAATRGI